MHILVASILAKSAVLYFMVADYLIYLRMFQAARKLRPF